MCYPHAVVPPFGESRDPPASTRRLTGTPRPPGDPALPSLIRTLNPLPTPPPDGHLRLATTPNRTDRGGGKTGFGEKDAQGGWVRTNLVALKGQGH